MKMKLRMGYTDQDGNTGILVWPVEVGTTCLSTCDGIMYPKVIRNVEVSTLYDDEYNVMNPAVGVLDALITKYEKILNERAGEWVSVSCIIGDLLDTLMTMRKIY